MRSAWLRLIACCALLLALAACSSPPPPRQPSPPSRAAFNAAFTKVVHCTSPAGQWGRAVPGTRRLIQCAAPRHALKADMTCAVHGAAHSGADSQWFGLWDQLIAAACIATGGRTTRLPRSYGEATPPGGVD